MNPYVLEAIICALIGIIVWRVRTWLKAWHCAIHHQPAHIFSRVRTWDDAERSVDQYFDDLRGAVWCEECKHTIESTGKSAVWRRAYSGIIHTERGQAYLEMREKHLSEREQRLG